MQITLADLRSLLNSPAKDAVLYKPFLDSGESLPLEVRAGDEVDYYQVVISREELIMILGNDPTDSDLARYLPWLQVSYDQRGASHAPGGIVRYVGGPLDGAEKDATGWFDDQLRMGAQEIVDGWTNRADYYPDDDGDPLVWLYRGPVPG